MCPKNEEHHDDLSLICIFICAMVASVEYGDFLLHAFDCSDLLLRQASALVIGPPQLI